MKNKILIFVLVVACCFCTLFINNNSYHKPINIQPFTLQQNTIKNNETQQTDKTNLLQNEKVNSNNDIEQKNLNENNANNENKENKDIIKNNSNFTNIEEKNLLKDGNLENTQSNKQQNEQNNETNVKNLELNSTNTKGFAEILENIQLITVLGEGIYITNPDTAEISFGIQTRAKTIAEGYEEIKSIYNKFIETLNSIDNISTQSFVINYSSAYPVQNSPVCEYQFNCNFSIKTKELSQIDNIIKKASEAGINSYNNVCYTIDDKTNAYNEALKIAKENALNKVSALYTNAVLKELQEVSIYTYTAPNAEGIISVEARLKAKFIVNSNNIANDNTNNLTNSNENNVDIDKDMLIKNYPTVNSDTNNNLNKVENFTNNNKENIQNNNIIKNNISSEK